VGDASTAVAGPLVPACVRATRTPRERLHARITHRDAMPCIHGETQRRHRIPQDIARSRLARPGTHDEQAPVLRHQQHPGRLGAEGHGGSSIIAHCSLLIAHCSLLIAQRPLLPPVTCAAADQADAGNARRPEHNLQPYALSKRSRQNGSCEH
jgi:hypothetical protein